MKYNVVTDNIHKRQELTEETEKYCLSSSAETDCCEATNTRKILIRKQNDATIQNKRVTHLRLSKSFSGAKQKPIIPKNFRHINVGRCENSRSYSDLASIISNHSTKKDIDFVDSKLKELKQNRSAGVINGKKTQYNTYGKNILPNDIT